MASIYKRGGTLWISYTLPSGERVQKSLKLKATSQGYALAREQKRQTEAMLTLTPESLESERIAERGRVVITEVLERFLNAEGGDRAPKTQALYRLAVRHFVESCGDLRLWHITPEVLFEFKRSLVEQSGDYNAARDLSSLRRVLNWAVECELLDRSPVRRGLIPATLPQPVRVFKDWEVDEILRIVAQRRPKLALILECLVLTGFRCGEVLAIEKANIDLSRGSLNVLNRKEGRWETFPIDDTLRAHLERALAASDPDSPYVYAYRDTTTVHHYTKPIIREVCSDKSLNIHTFKKTYVSRLVRAGLSEAVTHKLSHHRDIKTTLKYYTQFDQRQLRAGLEASRRVSGAGWTEGVLERAKNSDSGEG